MQKTALMILAGSLALAGAAAAQEEKKKETRVEVVRIDEGKGPVRVMFHGEGIDKNKDGEITRDEFMAPHGDLFTELDKDKNGRLSKEEMHDGPMRHMRGGPGHEGGPNRDVMVLRHGGPGMRALHVEHDGPHERTDMDANKDGKVSFEEFAAPLRKGFEAADANKSGFLEEGEQSKGPFVIHREIKTERK